eukprot:evm.model.scf_397.11 EVM.evm.TU.scf_397.11   scf_397:81831-82886(+)
MLCLCVVYERVCPSILPVHCCSTLDACSHLVLVLIGRDGSLRHESHPPHALPALRPPPDRSRGQAAHAHKPMGRTVFPLQGKPPGLPVHEAYSYRPPESLLFSTYHRQTPRTTACSVPKVLLAGCLLSTALIAAIYFDTHRVAGTVDWLRDSGAPGAAMFFTATSLGIVLLFPGSLLSMAAGAVYGTLAGSLLSWSATLVGQTMAFLLGRYLLLDCVSQTLVQHVPALGAINAAIAEDGWKIIVLLRLSPFVPYNLLNYALATTGVGIVPYSLASAVGIIPWVGVFAHFGTMAGEVATGETSGNEGSLNSWVSWMWLLGGVCTLGGAGIYTRKAVNNRSRKMAKERLDGAW